MKFIFLDEFKYDHSNQNKIYGLTAVVIDLQYYLAFKESFYGALKKIKWDKNLELKGRSMFSSSGDKNVNIESRINFMSEVVNISKSKSGKTAKIHVYVSINKFIKEKKEYECYLNNLEEILKKISKPSSKKKSLVSLCYDNNDCINKKDFNQKINDLLKKRNLNLFESSFSVESSMDNPGTLFADYVSYFHQNFLQLIKFRTNNSDRLVSLLEKDKNGSIDNKEKKELESYLINYKKERKSKELILALKSVIYV